MLQVECSSTLERLDKKLLGQLLFYQNLTGIPDTKAQEIADNYLLNKEYPVFPKFKYYLSGTMPQTNYKTPVRFTTKIFNKDAVFNTGIFFCTVEGEG